MSTQKMQIVRHGDDYEPLQVSAWRMRELLQHERDNAELRAEIARLKAELMVRGAAQESGTPKGDSE